MMRSTDTHAPTPGKPCEYYKLPHASEKYPYAKCVGTGKYRVDDLIPSIMLCQDHYTQYEAAKDGTIVSLSVRRR